jgi:hypothetical protein
LGVVCHVDLHVMPMFAFQGVKLSVGSADKVLGDEPNHLGHQAFGDGRTARNGSII